MKGDVYRDVRSAKMIETRHGLESNPEKNRTAESEAATMEKLISFVCEPLLQAQTTANNTAKPSVIF